MNFNMIILKELHKRYHKQILNSFGSLRDSYTWINYNKGKLNNFYQNRLIFKYELQTLDYFSVDK